MTLTLGTASISDGNVDYTQLCSGSSVDLSQLPALDVDAATGYVKVTAGLLQNAFQDCISIIDQVTSFGFQPSSSASSSSPISFCLDDISLLPPTLQTGGLFLLSPDIALPTSFAKSDIICCLALAELCHLKLPEVAEKALGKRVEQLRTAKACRTSRNSQPAM